MSDFLSRDLLPDLWDEILKRHWTFLETEESMQKLEERKKLEGCLKEFLCIVPHDRKFFLPETAHVLRKSIREMDDFSAYKAIIGFEAISQYANNLFTQPWRKEFRILKMYSGFFQHEVNSNLLDAEKLFEAMGYRRLTDDILVLDGPICPDQVTNVSRDAMAAYVECQIMKNIYAGLVSLGLSASWQDVFSFREKYAGGSSQAIKSLAYALQERRLRKEKLISTENCYASIQHSPQALPSKQSLPLSAQCSNCALYHMSQAQQLPAQPIMPNGQCALHSSNVCPTHGAQPPATNLHYNGANPKLIASYPNYQQQQQQAGHPYIMSHSRSLEHYNEPPTLVPHRHSFDHQQQGCMAHHYQQAHAHPPHLYESPYDCLDGNSVGSTVSYAAVAASAGNCGVNAAYSHPYNVSGNRYPLPYNISNQLNSHYATPTVTCNGVKGEPCGGGGVEHEYATVAKPHSCGHPAQPPLPPTRHSSSANAVKDFQGNKQAAGGYPQDHHLIDFDDRAALTAHDFHAQMHHNHYDYEQQQQQLYDQHRRLLKRANANALYAQPKDVLCMHGGGAGAGAAPQMVAPDDAYGGNYVYARPLPRGHRVKPAQSNGTDKHLRNSEDCVDNNRKMLTELKEQMAGMNGGSSSSSKRRLSSTTNERDTSDPSYDSTLDDFVTVGHSEHVQQRSPTQASKNQDGVGSFESWHYVFKNLDRSGYNKDTGERGDLLVQSLDLDSLNLANSAGAVGGADKRRSSQVDSKTLRQVNGEKSRTLEKAPSTAAKPESKANVKVERSILKQPNTNTASGTGNSQLATTLKAKTKSALKPTAKTASASNGKHNNFGAPTLSQINGAVASTSASAGKRPGTSTLRAPGTKQKGPVATQVIVSSPNEWSCRFCTFLNPDTKRICEMCCRSKDFNLEASVSNTPTCV